MNKRDENIINGEIADNFESFAMTIAVRLQQGQEEYKRLLNRDPVLAKAQKLANISLKRTYDILNKERCNARARLTAEAFYDLHPMVVEWVKNNEIKIGKKRYASCNNKHAFRNFLESKWTLDPADTDHVLDNIKFIIKTYDRPRSWKRLQAHLESLNIDREEISHSKQYNGHWVDIRFRNSTQAQEARKLLDRLGWRMSLSSRLTDNLTVLTIQITPINEKAA